jgi:hypothetical protein
MYLGRARLRKTGKLLRKLLELVEDDLAVIQLLKAGLPRDVHLTVVRLALLRSMFSLHVRKAFSADLLPAEWRICTFPIGRVHRGLAFWISATVLRPPLPKLFSIISPLVVRFIDAYYCHESNFILLKTCS